MDFEMNGGSVKAPPVKADLNMLLGLNGPSHAAMSAEIRALPASAEVSAVGVMLLTAVSVVMAILGVVFLGVFLIVCWWVITHIPVPPVVTQILGKLGLSG